MPTNASVRYDEDEMALVYQIRREGSDFDDVAKAVLIDARSVVAQIEPKNEVATGPIFSVVLDIAVTCPESTDDDDTIMRDYRRQMKIDTGLHSMTSVTAPMHVLSFW